MSIAKILDDIEKDYKALLAAFEEELVILKKKNDELEKAVTDIKELTSNITET